MSLYKAISIFFVMCVYSFLYLPIALLVVYSFSGSVFPSHFTSFTLDWYPLLFKETDLWSAFFTSFAVGISTTTLCVFLSLSYIYCVFSKIIQRAQLTFFYGNLVIPDTMLALGLLSFFSYLQIHLGYMTLTIAHSLIGIGVMIPIVFLRYNSLDHNLVDTARMLGANSTQVFFSIIIPQLKTTLFAASLLVFVLSFDDYVFSFFCGGTGIETLSMYIARSLKSGIDPTINALSTLLLLFTSLMTLFFFSIRQRTRIF